VESSKCMWVFELTRPVESSKCMWVFN
jgi:hypothetical protein